MSRTQRNTKPTSGRDASRDFPLQSRRETSPSSHHGIRTIAAFSQWSQFSHGRSPKGRTPLSLLFAPCFERVHESFWPCFDDPAGWILFLLEFSPPRNAKRQDHASSELSTRQRELCRSSERHDQVVGPSEWFSRRDRSPGVVSGVRGGVRQSADAGSMKGARKARGERGEWA
jgi:hypothetical protein